MLSKCYQNATKMLSNYYQNIVGQIFVFFVLTITAAEAAVGLAIIVIFFRIKDSIHIDDIDSLKE